MPTEAAELMADEDELDPVVPQDEPEAEANGDDGESQITGEPADVTTEQRARAMGWHPLSEYRGDPRRWCSAEEFIRRGETELPIMRDQNRRMSERLARIEPEVAKLTETTHEQTQLLREMHQRTKAADERGYQRAMTELKARKREAVEAGDTAAFDEVEQQIDELQTARTAVEPPAPAAPAPQPPAQDPEIAVFLRDNPWFQSNATLNVAMVSAHTLVKARNPDMPLSEQLDLAKQRVAADFPEHFTDDEDPMPATAPPARPRQAAPVARPTGGQPPRPAPSGFDTISDPQDRAEAKAAFGRMQRQIPDLKVAEYMTLYNDPRADILTIRNQARAK